MSTKGYQRLLEMALTLKQGGIVGVPVADLMQKVGYADDDAGKRAMMRDLNDLRASGLEIRNLAPLGEDARYALEPGDVRWRLEFTTEQHNALQAALSAAETHGIVEMARPEPTVDLHRVQAAVNSRCMMTFRYNGSDRIVDPMNWGWSHHALVVQGWERESQMVKTYAVERMQNLSIRSPGSARVPADIERPGLDPITWLVDEPVTAVLTCPGFAADVVALVGGEVVGDQVHTIVTNRLIFLARVLELGSRAVLSSPEELRDELRDMLRGAL